MTDRFAQDEYYKLFDPYHTALGGIQAAGGAQS